MLKNKYYIVTYFFAFCAIHSNAQTLSLKAILDTIQVQNPQLKMYDSEIKSMDEKAAGAKSWMNPQVSTGFFMTPYNANMWKVNDMNSGMGSYMLGATQMFPNPKKQNAEFNYMKAMSSVEKENRNFTINELKAIAKDAYSEWIIINKKVVVLKQNAELMNYMIKSMEIRYQYNMDKLSSYYKAKSQLGTLESMIVMLQNEQNQKLINLNTLMARDKNTSFQIDTLYTLKTFDTQINDTSTLMNNRSDIQMLNKSIVLNDLQVKVEKSKYLPEFGVKYDHMFTFGKNPQMFSLMGMVSIPMFYSTKMNRANIKSLKFKNEAISWQKEMILNNSTGMLNSMNENLKTLTKQFSISENTIIPALKKNYETSLIAWQNNSGNLFEVLDGWEALNMAEIDALDKLQNILKMQVEIEKQLEIK
jgi:outer membrane protein TolC